MYVVNKTVRKNTKARAARRIGAKCVIYPPQRGASKRMPLGRHFAKPTGVVISPIYPASAEQTAEYLVGQQVQRAAMAFKFSPNPIGRFLHRMRQNLFYTTRKELSAFSAFPR